MSKNIEINYKSDVGYEVLYPNTMLNSVLDWQENLYSKDEILDSATKALYGLGEDSVPKDVLGFLRESAVFGDNLEKYGVPNLRIGQYNGIGGKVLPLQFEKMPILLSIGEQQTTYTGYQFVLFKSYDGWFSVLYENPSGGNQWYKDMASFSSTGIIQMAQIDSANLLGATYNYYGFFF